MAERGRWGRLASRLRPDAPAADAAEAPPHEGVRLAAVLLCEPADLPALPRGLASVLAQRHRPLQVLLCAVGPEAARAEVTSRLADAVTAHEASSSRADDPDLNVVLGPEGLDWTTAATAGLDAADGDYLTLVRACDLVPPGAWDHAAERLAGTGAALALGPVGQGGETDPWLAAAQARAHEHAVTTSLDAGGPTGAVAEHGSLGGVLLRRDLLASGGPLAGGVDPADAEDPDGFAASLTLAALLAGLPGDDEVAVLDQPLYTLSPDHGRRAYGATPDPLPALERRHQRARAVVDRLDTRPDLADAAARGWAASGLPRLLVEAESATDEQWHRLVDLAREVPAAELPGLPTAARCLVWLAAADRRDDVEVLAEDLERPDLRDTPPTEVRDGEVLAAWPAAAGAADLPDDVRTLSRDETPLRVRGVRRRDDGCDLLVALDGVDLTAAAATVTVRLVAAAGPASGTPALLSPGAHPRARSPLPIDVADSAEATRWAAHPWCRGLRVGVELPADLAASQEVALLVDVVQDGVARVTTGFVTLPPRPRRPAGAPALELTDVDLEPDPDGDRLVLRGSGDLAAVRLDGPAEAVEPTLRRTAEGVAELVLPLAGPRWGQVRPLPPGAYRVVAGGRPAPLADALRSRLPDDLLGATYRVRAGLGARGGLVANLAPPLGDDEAGPFAQRELQEAYARAVVSRRPLDPTLVYAETYGGRTATDSPRAIVEALRRQRPELRVRWGVSDAGQAVPEGTEPVLLRSREHYDVLADARLLVLNTDVETWFEGRDDQFLLQCFHGYPSKAMGRSQWDALDLRPSRERALRHRGVDSWSAILTPTPAMTALYREQYDYHGPAVEEGYPRDDDLTDPGSAAARLRRRRTRDLLGLGDRIAVLYAPTWREQLATRPRGAAMSDHLDVAAAARALGDSYALLLRGHRFHDPAGSRAPLGSAPVVDVTTYPEINDLVLACDVAVLDYSSLRFDVALARRPMVFLVPDLDDYAAGSRRFLFPFTDSAPGPLVASTEEVVALLGDVDTLRGATAGPIEDFNQRYHPHQDGRAAERVAARLLDLAGM